MTVLEFESWVSDNYDELLKLSTNTTRTTQDAEDNLHDLIESFCDGRRRLPPWPIEKLKVGSFYQRLVSMRITRHRDDGVLAGSVQARDSSEDHADDALVVQEESIGSVLPAEMEQEVLALFNQLPALTKRIWRERLLAGVEDEPLPWATVALRFDLTSLQCRHKIEDAERWVRRHLSPTIRGFLVRAERVFMARWLGDPQYRGPLMKSSRAKLRASCSRARAITSKPAYRRAG